MHNLSDRGQIIKNNDKRIDKNDKKYKMIISGEIFGKAKQKYYESNRQNSKLKYLILWKTIIIGKNMSKNKIKIYYLFFIIIYWFIKDIWGTLVIMIHHYHQIPQIQMWNLVK